MIDRHTEERIKSVTKITDVMANLGLCLKRQGSGYVTICPFHNDRHPSMQINPVKNICKCFACGDKAMDSIEFIRKYKGYDYPTALRYLASMTGIIIEEELTPEWSAPVEAPAQLVEPTPEPLPTYADTRVMEASLKGYAENPLHVFVSSLFGPERATEAFLAYKVGTAKHRVNERQGARKSVVFWQVDELGQVRGGKILAYDESSGKRIKADSGKDVSWVHKAMRLPEYNLCQCLFGQHLISANTTRVNLVESEKTALLCSLFFPPSTGVWCATGGKSAEGRIREAYNVLAGKDIVLYPDCDAYADWQTMSDSLNAIGLKTEVSTATRQLATTKYDLGDFIVSKLRATPEPLPTTTTPPTPERPTSPEPATPEPAPTYPRAPHESSAEAADRNAEILRQGKEAYNILLEAYPSLRNDPHYLPPTARQIEILDPARPVPTEAPF